MRSVGLVLVAIALAVAGCGGGDGEPDASKVNAVTVGSLSEAEDRVVDELVDEVGAITVSGEPPLIVPPGFPREIPIEDVPSPIRGTLTAGDARDDVAVELAPHIYASRGTGELGIAEDYTSIAGLCVDIRQFERETGRTFGSSCY